MKVQTQNTTVIKKKLSFCKMACYSHDFVFSLSNTTGISLLTWHPEPVGSSTTWAQVTFTYTVSANGLLNIYPWNNDASQTVWFDDLTLNFSGTGAGIAKAEAQSMADYYAHGSLMPGRNYFGSPAYRYGYQGQFAEKDPETGKNSFELRNWDALLGRWSTIDPYGQHHSPYMGMSNNPINFVDPNGGWDDNRTGVWNEETQKYEYSVTGTEGGSKYDVYNWIGGSLDGQGGWRVDLPQSNGEYQNQYGDPSASLVNFKEHYSGLSLDQIVTGQSSFLGYTFPNYVDPAYRFVNIDNGRQVDMTHFLVVGPRGNLMGIGNEIKQIFSHPQSAFYPQDIYSNRLGVNFFNSYGPLIKQNPNNISKYIYWFLSNPNNIKFAPINWDAGPKY